MSNEDDFWNESSSSRFNFFDDDDDISATETDNFLSNVPENVTLPIHSIISNKCLNLILNESESSIEYSVTPAEDTVKHMFHGENFVLIAYRTLDQKLQLLDSAIEIGDGNIILTVILFLNKTLNNNIFFTQLSNRKVAIRHFANYLIEKSLLQELADLYMATGNIYNMKDIYCLLSRDILNQNLLIKKMQQFNIHYSQNLYNSEDKLEIQDNLSLLDFQIQNKLNSRSVIGQLINLCKSEWQKGNGDDNINNFKKIFKIDDFQYEWVMMNVLCQMKNWDRLLSIFLKSVWVLKKRALKSVIRPDLFVIGISRYNPPENITEQFLSCVGDTSKMLFLAEKFKIHMFVVNHYVEQKDKISILKYLEKVEAANPAFSAIQTILNSDIKWRN